MSIAVATGPLHVTEDGLYQGTALAVPQSGREMRALAPVAGAKAQVMRVFGMAKAMP